MADGARGKPARKAGAKPKAKATGAGEPRRRKSETDAAYKRRVAAWRKKRDAEKERAKQAAVESDPAGAAEQELTGPAKTVENGALYLAIYKDWARGLTFDALSAKHTLSPRRCQEVVESLKGRRIQRLGLANPLYGSQLARELILRYTASVSEYAELATGVTEPSMAHVKLGYLKRRDEAMDKFKDLMQELGYLPRNLGTLHVQEDFIGLMETLLDGMDELGVPVDVQRQLVERVELRVVQQRDGRLGLAAGDPVGGQEEVVDAEVVGEVAAA